MSLLPVNTDVWWTKIDFLSQYYLNARYKEDILELQEKITRELPY